MADEHSDQLTRIERKVDRIYDWLYGDNSTTKPGAEKRLDRLESAEIARERTLARMMKGLWTITAATVAAVIGMLWQAIFR